MKNGTTISVSSIFHAPAEKIWELLLRIDTLQTIAKPYAYFTPLGDMPEWKQDAQCKLILKAFGIFSFGVHQIHIVKLDKDSWLLETHESNRTVKVWNHTICLEPLPDGNTGYTDTVTLNAGNVTFFIKMWSLMFYRHRQKRWTRLLSELA